MNMPAPHYVVRHQRGAFWALVRVHPGNVETCIDRALTKAEAIKAARLLVGGLSGGTYTVEKRASRRP